MVIEDALCLRVRVRKKKERAKATSPSRFFLLPVEGEIVCRHVAETGSCDVFLEHDLP